jgi:hypothetical protein
MKVKKIEEFIIPETGAKVIIIGDVETNGARYAEGHISFPKKKE